MKLPFPATLLACALLLPSLAHAADAPLTDTLKAFTRCDAEFFSKLHAHRDEWKAYAPLEVDKENAWIAVRNRASDKENSVPISTPPIVGLKLLSYSDISAEMDELGNYYYWGFTVQGSVDEVARLMVPLMPQPALLQRAGNGYVRSEVKDGNTWRAIVAQPSTAPGTQRVERLLLIEPEAKQRDQTRVSCSVQGGVDGALLARLRPDIAPANYPQRTPDTAIDSVAVDPALIKRLESPLLQPKFKTLSYTYVSRKGGAIDGRPVTVEFTTDGGLLKKNEIYSPNFHVERLTQADLIQLKGKMNGIGDGRVLLTRDVKVKMPSRWAAGETLSATFDMVDVPAKASDRPTNNAMTCTVGQRFPARQIHTALSGDAIRLACDADGYQTSRAFIEDLGVALTLDSTSKSERTVYEFTEVNVVK